MPRSIKDTRIIVKRDLDSSKFPNGNASDGGTAGDSFTWTMTVPPRGFIVRAQMRIIHTAWGPDFNRFEDDGCIFLLSDGPADGSEGTNPLSSTQINSIFGHSIMNGMYGGEQGGKLRLVYEYPLSLYCTMYTLDFSPQMPIGSGTTRANQGSGPTGLYYDLSTELGPSGGDATIYFTWVSSARNWSDDSHSAQFRLEIEPR